MYDGRKIVIGLVIGLGLFLSPFLYNAGRAAKAPDPVLTEKAKEAGECVASKSYMTTSHFVLLDLWRNSVVRDGERYHQSETGKVYFKSLQVTCMECHANKSKFCDECHNYVDVNPYCWDCHIAPIEVEEKN